VHLHATAPTTACPPCGTAGSRVHSRYSRTIADVAFGRRCLVLKLLVRKWICPLASCPQRIKASRFPELVQRSARMTDRLIEALQSTGVTTNGADAAQILSSLGMPTTAKPIIRRVLQLALPKEGTVRLAGRDEWAWKKGSHYGTYLSSLSKRWNEGCQKAVQLYEEVVAQGYTGSLRTIETIVKAFRRRGTKLVSSRPITLQKVPSARRTALMILRPAKNRTPEQTAFIEHLCQSDPTLATAFTLTQEFGQLLRQREGKSRLDQWKAAVVADGIAELMDFVDGLADDAEAVANGCSESWSNGMGEGFIKKVKWIKRRTSGQAGFPLLQRHVLLTGRRSA
jgi:transposase